MDSSRALALRYDANLTNTNCHDFKSEFIGSNLYDLLRTVPGRAVLRMQGRASLRYTLKLNPPFQFSRIPHPLQTDAVNFASDGASHFA